MASIPDEFVVTTEHRGLILRELERRGLGTGHHLHENRALGLTLVDLPGEDEVRRLARELWAEVPEDTRRRLPEPAGAGPDEQLLTSLRGWFGARYEGWAPTMGKNRLLNGIELLPYTSVHGDDRPVAVAAPAGADTARPTWPADPRLRRVQVGIIDARLVRHSRLEGGYVADPAGLDATPPPEGRQWWQGHATFIANLVLTRAPSAWLDVRAGFEHTEGDAEPPGLRLWTFAERLDAFRDSGVQVLNCSMGCVTEDGRAPLVLERAIARLTSDMVVVAAAGNHGAPPRGAAPAAGRKPAEVRESPRAAMFPAALDGVLSVGATTDDGTVADFNPRGAGDREWAPWIDVFVRGTDLVSAYLGDGGGEPVRMPAQDDGSPAPDATFRGWARWSGTSFAAAEMTGILAAEIARGATPAQAEASVREAVREDPRYRGVPAS